LLQTAKSAGVEQRIVSTVVDVNDSRKGRMAERVARAVGGLKGKRIAVLGLAFKPNTDDMRDAPSLPLVAGLLAGGATVAAFDPVAMDQARPLMAGVDMASDAETAARDADALVIVTEWDEFRALDLGAIAATMRGKVLVDLRNVYDRAEAERAGLTYYGVGRGRL
jgi:UDPglucose 6-dehydrogenase